MNYWYGKELAVDILSNLPVTKPNYNMYVIGGDENDPYYRGICRDATKCNITVYNDSEYNGIGMWPAISLNSKIKIPDVCNLDGGHLTPCTATATIRLLLHYCFGFEGVHAVILGRSERVGKPIAKLLCDLNATVSLIHSRSRKESVNELISHADLIISCVGNANFYNRYMRFKKTATIVDIGGDFIGITDIENYVPHIGGVGPVTRAVLMERVVNFKKEINNE